MTTDRKVYTEEFKRDAVRMMRNRGTRTVAEVADEIASAAGLLMEKAGAIPAVVVRGYQYEPFEGSAKILIRPAEADLFR